MNISFKGFGENVATFEADSTLTKAGTAVKIASSGKAVPCSDGDKICGVAVSVRDGYAAVQLKGYIELKYSGNIAPGYQTVAVDDNGKVEVNENGREVLVVSVTDGMAGLIL